MSTPPSIATQLQTLFTRPHALLALRGMLRGLEKESLRVTEEATLAKTAHPELLGAALTHPQITTDYSEALLEFITQPHPRIDALLAELDQIHRFTYAQLSPLRERLWPSSMPCLLGKDSDIPVAQYGSSNSGTMKTVYREGLGHRYGRAMQTIAGVHYNISFSDDLWQELKNVQQNELPLAQFKTEGYFGIIRNFRRYFTLLVYLFGASPAISRNFVKDRAHQLDTHPSSPDTLYLPYATSLRMGDLGYQSDAQKALVIDYNCIGDYVKTLCNAITQSHPDYATLGQRAADGSYRQLNTSLLQIENEFYSSIRPKRTTQRGETALHALKHRGVEYVEVRCIDLNPYEPLGINATQIRFMDAFLLFCLISPSPLSDASEFLDIQENQRRVVNQGRKPGLTLKTKEGEIGFVSWSKNLLSRIAECAVYLDKAYEIDSADTNSFTQALNEQYSKLDDMELTPSARFAADLTQTGESFIGLTQTLAKQHQAYFEKTPLSEPLTQEFVLRSQKSLADQNILENDHSMTFEQYISNYYNQYTKGCAG